MSVISSPARPDTMPPTRGYEPPPPAMLDSALCHHCNKNRLTQGSVLPAQRDRSLQGVRRATRRRTRRR
jgi:hypothetical protein